MPESVDWGAEYMLEPRDLPYIITNTFMIEFFNLVTVRGVCLQKFEWFFHVILPPFALFTSPKLDWADWHKSQRFAEHFAQF